jgi:hypothetical protein
LLALLDPERGEVRIGGNVCPVFAFVLFSAGCTDSKVEFNPPLGWGLFPNDLRIFERRMV